jgi:porin
MPAAATILASVILAQDGAAPAADAAPPAGPLHWLFTPRYPVSPPPEDTSESMKQLGAGGFLDLLRQQSQEQGDLTARLNAAQGMRWFPADIPQLMPYLAASNQVGGSCLQTGALIASDPISDAAQAVKTELAKYGVNYAIWQAYNFSAMSNVLPGRSHTLNEYGVQALTRTNVFTSDELTGTSAWFVLGANAGIGLGVDANAQSPQLNVGANGQTLGDWYGDNIYLTQCMWQQSFFDGHLLAMVGMMDPEFVCDLNTFSNNPYNQLLNNEFINQATMPWTCQSLGVCLQWQPNESFYAIWALAQNNLPPGGDAFAMLSANDMTTMFELGFIDPEFLGMGRGVLRIEPYAANVDGHGGFGCDFNVEQQLWKEGPLGFFARAGFGNRDVTIIQNARTQVSGGLVLAGKNDDVFMKSDQAYLGAAMYWLEAASTTAAHPQEWGFELTYTYQLTPTLTIQPDLQFVLNPLNNTASDHATVFTIQMNCTW